jgi:hypothetical protein
MKITQVTSEFVKDNMAMDNLYRILVCDDTHGNTGKNHYSARIKPVRNLSVEEFTDSINNPEFGFIRIEEDK